MAVNGTGSSTGSLLSSNRMTMSGLATGMNTEEIIAGMTVGTRNKIQKLQQDKTLLGWRSESFRAVTDKLVSLSSKYTSFMSPSTNLMSTRLFAKSVVTAQGANAGKVSVSGAGHDNISIAGVKELATNASVTSGAVSSGEIATETINLAASVDVSKIEGGNLKIKYGNTEFDLTLTAGKDYSSAEKIVASLNSILSETNLSADMKLSEKIKFELDGSGENGKIKLSFNGSSAGNSLEITGGSDKVLEGLGLKDKVGESVSEGSSIEGNEINKNSYTDSQNAKDLLAGKSMTFMLDGVRKTIKLPEKDAAEWNSITDAATLGSHIQGKLNAEFGTGKITVAESSGKLTFKPANSTSILKLTEADKEISGSKGVFGNITGNSNRINLDAKIGEAGFAGFDLTSLETEEIDGITNYKMEINGKSIAGITDKTTVRELMDKINASDAGIKISYMEMADRFNITSTIEGEKGQAGYGDSIDSKDNLAKQLFGEFSRNSKVAGKDAVISIKYKGTNDIVDITRSSNTIDLEGMKVTLKGTFGTYDGTGKLQAGTEEITFSAKTDDTKLLDAVKGFVKDYNDMIDAVNKQVSTQRPKSSGQYYAPLTDEQRKEMSDKEIETWESKAKEGLLYNDMDLRNLLSDFRFVFGQDGAGMGIKVSTNYKDNGKLELDEEAFKEALATDPQKVQDFFAKAPTGTDKGGVMYKVKDALDKYAKTEGATKGILVSKAGHSNSPTSILSNYFTKQIEQMEKSISRYQLTLKAQEDRYSKQFTNLETFVQRMNMQSGYLMQQFGGGM